MHFISFLTVSTETSNRKGISLSTRDAATHDYEVKVCVPPSCYGDKAWACHQA